MDIEISSGLVGASKGLPINMDIDNMVFPTF